MRTSEQNLIELRESLDKATQDLSRAGVETAADPRSISTDRPGAASRNLP